MFQCGLPDVWDSFGNTCYNRVSHSGFAYNKDHAPNESMFVLDCFLAQRRRYEYLYRSCPHFFPILHHPRTADEIDPEINNSWLLWFESTVRDSTSHQGETACANV